MEIARRSRSFGRWSTRRKITIPMRSRKMFALSTLYDANEELLGDKIGEEGTNGYKQKLETAVA